MQSQGTSHARGSIKDSTKELDPAERRKLKQLEKAEKDKKLRQQEKHNERLRLENERLGQELVDAAAKGRHRKHKDVSDIDADIAIRRANIEALAKLGEPGSVPHEIVTRTQRPTMTSEQIDEQLRSRAASKRPVDSLGYNTDLIDRLHSIRGANEMDDDDDDDVWDDPENPPYMGSVIDEPDINPWDKQLDIGLRPATKKQGLINPNTPQGTFIPSTGTRTQNTGAVLGSGTGPDAIEASLHTAPASSLPGQQGDASVPDQEPQFTPGLDETGFSEEPESNQELTTMANDDEGLVDDVGEGMVDEPNIDQGRESADKVWQMMQQHQLDKQRMEQEINQKMEQQKMETFQRQQEFEARARAAEEQRNMEQFKHEMQTKHDMEVAAMQEQLRAMQEENARREDQQNQMDFKTEIQSREEILRGEIQNEKEQREKEINDEREKHEKEIKDMEDQLENMRQEMIETQQESTEHARFVTPEQQAAQRAKLEEMEQEAKIRELHHDKVMQQMSHLRTLNLEMQRDKEMNAMNWTTEERNEAEDREQSLRDQIQALEDQERRRIDKVSFDEAVEQKLLNDPRFSSPSTMSAREQAEFQTEKTLMKAGIAPDQGMIGSSSIRPFASGQSGATQATSTTLPEAIKFFQAIHEMLLKDLKAVRKMNEEQIEEAKERIKEEHKK
jgi:hypothetical protein